VNKTPRSFVYDGEPTRLDKAVVDQYGAQLSVSRSQIERWIEEGGVSVNGRVVTRSSHKLAAGDEVVVSSVSEAKSELSPYEVPLDILYEDNDLIVVNKPYGLSMHPGAGNREKTLANAIVAHVGRSQSRVGESDRPGIVHRLDKDTTGVVVVAKSTSVHAALAKQFAERSVDRSYQTLVFTTPRAKRAVQISDAGEVIGAIGRHPTKRTMMAVIPGGKAAVTLWRVIERFEYGTLLECRLKTGRTHQIRVHMNSIGCPVIGDTVYGDFSGLPLRLRDAAHRFGRQALHAYRLGFSHPITGDRLFFDAALPGDFKELLRVFSSSNRR